MPAERDRYRLIGRRPYRGFNSKRAAVDASIDLEVVRERERVDEIGPGAVLKARPKTRVLALDDLPSRGGGHGAVDGQLVLVGREREPGEIDVHIGGAIAPPVQAVRPRRQQRHSGLLALLVPGDALGEVNELLAVPSKRR